MPELNADHPVTVAELIERLKTFEPGLIVWVVDRMVDGPIEYLEVREADVDRPRRLEMA